MMRVTPCRLMTLQCSQIGFTLLRTFTSLLPTMLERGPKPSNFFPRLAFENTQANRSRQGGGPGQSVMAERVSGTPPRPSPRAGPSDAPHHGLELRRWILRLRHHPAKNDVARTRLRRLGGRDRALLIVQPAAGRANPRDEELEALTILGPDFPGLQTAANHAVRAHGGAVPRQSKHLSVNLQGLSAPGAAQRRRVQRGENRHSQNSTPVAGALYGRLDHFPPTRGVDRQQPRPDGRGAARGAANGVGDVVQLEVQEHVVAERAEGLDHLRTSRGKQLATNLVEPAGVTQPLDHGE